jgi:hypothetical protein
VDIALFKNLATLRAPLVLKAEMNGENGPRLMRVQRIFLSRLKKSLKKTKAGQVSAIGLGLVALLIRPEFFVHFRKPAPLCAASG